MSAAVLTLAQAVELARLLQSFGQSDDEILGNALIPVVLRDEVAQAIRVLRIPEPEEASAEARDWTGGLASDSGYFWPRLRQYLAGTKGWGPEAVDSVEEQSLRVLRRLPDPALARFSARGLVVGYVQSGKTANYTAVIARAVDAGYRLIIVLAGTENALREQTQRRLDQELTGEAAAGLPSVGRPERGRWWVRLTREGEDFAGNLPLGVLQGGAPVLAVVKKQVQVLQALLDELVSAGWDALQHTPTLVIDDESDHASINTGEDRPAVDTALSDDEIEIEAADTAPSKTNAIIRRILQQLPRHAYVGYTATPFANVLINPDAFDREVGEGLYPRDFILQLARPRGYTGTEELFGARSQETPGRGVLRLIPDAEVEALRPRRGRGAGSASGIPPSLATALLDFLLASALRRWRGQADGMNTMLVHVSHLTERQRRLRTLIQVHLDDLRGEWSHGGAQAAIRTRLSERWIEDFSLDVDDLAGRPDSLAELETHLEAVLGALEVRELNSTTGEVLDDGQGARPIIAVGGNRLSRGLTLEGLTVSYFLRTSGMCDTLLQMARWYGYRQGYEDLLRLHTTGELAAWFTELAVIEGDLRDEIDDMNRRGLSPRDQGVRIRAHSSMLVTSRLKMKHGTRIRAGYSGEHPQSIVLPLGDLDALNANRAAAEVLLRQGRSAQREDGSVLVEAVPPEAVVEFILRFQLGAEARHLDPVHLAAWIQQRAAAGDLSAWTLYLDSRQDRARGTARIGGFDIGLVERSRLKGTSSVGALIDPRHEGLDLVGGPQAFMRARSFDTAAMREARPRTQGLLLLYPLSPDSRPSRRGNRVPLFAEEQARPEVVMGYGLSLPVTGEDSAVEYIVGQRWSGDAR